ncbi:MAG: BamA/TamA family outer membrane protein [SAR86 cluster bacterium]
MSSHVGLRGVWLALLMTPGWALGADLNCQADATFEDYEPTLPGYDFNAGLQRWGDDIDRIKVGHKKTVRKIYINTLPIFDPANAQENFALYRWANSVHRYTRPAVIERLLLFSTGEQVDDHLLDESERLLRQENYIADSAIRVVRDCLDEVDLEVVTHEVWTLTPEISVKSSGGDTSTSLGFRDANFLGSGKSIGLGVKQEPDRNKLQFHYNDRYFQGKRLNLSVRVEKNSDGYYRSFDVRLPFYALDTRRSWGVGATESLLTQSRYVDAVKVSALQVQDQAVSTYFGMSEGLIDGQVARYLFGLQLEKQHYATLPDEIAPVRVPDDLNLAYPFVEYQQVQDDYKIGFNINQMKRSEDIHLGRDLRARLGYSPNGRQVILQGVWADTWLSRDKMLLQSNLSWRGRWDINRQAIADGELNLALKFHRGQTDNRSLVMAMEISMLKNPLDQYELTLGGDKGLRGYRSNYLSGDSLILLTMEERVFTQYEPFGLFNLGFAAFADVGRAWFRDVDVDKDGWKADVGVGLRLLPSKSDKGQVIHLDVAFPVNDRNSGRSMLVSVEMKRTL